MDQILEKSFDFSIRIIELTKYLDEEKKPFALRERLLKCGARIGVYLRLAESIGNRSAESGKQALSYAVEAEYLLEIMAITGYLTEKQSQPIISDCRAAQSTTNGTSQFVKLDFSPSAEQLFTGGTQKSKLLTEWLAP